MVMDQDSVLLSNPGCRLNEINADHDLLKKGPDLLNSRPTPCCYHLALKKPPFQSRIFFICLLSKTIR